MAQTNLFEITISTNQSHEIIPDYGIILEKMGVDEEVARLRIPENQEILVHYACMDEIWNRNKIIINDVFIFAVATKIIIRDGIEPHSVDDYQYRTD